MSGAARITRASVIALLSCLPFGAKAAAQGLEGLYAGTETYYTLARQNFNNIYYVFFPDGRVYRGVPKGGAISAFDFETAGQREPDNCGRYRISGGSIEFAWLGNRQGKTTTFVRSAGGVKIGGTDFSQIGSYDGLQLNGAYTRFGNAQFNPYDASAGGVVSERTIVFRSDGTFSTASAVAASTRASTIGENAGGGGRYHINGNALDLTYPDGRRTRSTFFVHPESAGEAPPRHIVIDGLSFGLEEGGTASTTPRATPPADPPRRARESRIVEDPGAASAAFKVGADLANAGKWSEAEPRYREAIRLDPNHALYHAALGLALLAQQRDSESLAESREAIRVGPAQAWYYSLTSEVFVRQERWDSSEVGLRQAIRLDSANSEYHTELGYVLFRQARYPESLTESKAALRLNPKDPSAHDNVGDALLHLGLLEPSEDEFRTAIRLSPKTPEFHYDLARVLSERGHNLEALAEARLALGADPGNTRYQELVQKLTGGK